NEVAKDNTQVAARAQKMKALYERYFAELRWYEEQLPFNWLLKVCQPQINRSYMSVPVQHACAIAEAALILHRAGKSIPEAVKFFEDRGVTNRGHFSLAELETALAPVCVYGSELRPEALKAIGQTQPVADPLAGF